MQPAREPPIATGAIPRTAHFVWFGREFPWLNVLAVRSAALRGDFERIALHHDSDLGGTPFFDILVATPRLELRRFDAGQLFGRAGALGEPLAAVFAGLERPATRSDLVRLAILYSEGGVYLDTDTVTVRSFRPLCEASQAFCGTERIVKPARVRRSRSPRVKLAAFARDQVRGLLRVAPGGWAAFRAIEHLYPAVANNAVLGSEPRGAFVTSLLRSLLALPPAEQKRLYAIGPHLLQDLASGFAPPELVVYPPEVFYPLGPEIAEHWFRKSRREPALDRVVTENTRLVHWYSSGRTRALLPQVDPGYVRENARRQLFSALALPFV